MKFAACLLLGTISLMFVAAAPRHTAFGPIKFGMTYDQAWDIEAPLRRKPFTAFDLRAHFLSSGTKKPGRLAALDTTIQIELRLDRPIVTGVSAVNQSDSYAKMKQAADVLRDVADSKFQRMGTPLPMPSEEELKAAGTGRAIVTDTWELDGLKIHLEVAFYNGASIHPGNPTVDAYEARLVAKEPETTATNAPAK